MGYYKNKLIEQDVEVGDRQPMTYVTTKSYYWTAAGIWTMAFITGLLIGGVI